MQPLENIELGPMSTFRIGGRARLFAVIRSKEELLEAFAYAELHGLTPHILGGGSNTLFVDGELDLFVLKIEIMGIEVMREDDEGVLIKMGAGENWDKAVEYVVKKNLWGIEAMSAIPGTVGATPVQNVGAYGQEIKDTLVEVETIDRKSREVRIFSNADCGFTYRNSIFKVSDNPFVVISVTLRLKKKMPEIRHYPDVKKYFEEHSDLEVTPSTIRDAVTLIRSRKLPDPSVIPNTGSFFKNVIVDIDTAEELKEKFPEMPQFETETSVKIPSGWLIEKAGFKGMKKGNIGVASTNALVLFNAGNATFQELMAFRDEIVSKVNEMFGVVLEQEPVIVK